MLVVEVPFDLHRLAAALGGEVSGDQVLAPGPNHSKADRSLAVKIDGTAPDGFLVHSFAKDDAVVCKSYVREKCGLPPFKANGGRRSSSEVAALLRSAVLSRQQEKPKGVLVATYNYTDKDNSLLYQVLRFEPKTFRQRRPDGNGGWIWKLEDRRVLYRLPELLQYPDATVFLCEGEKDADRVASLGHCSTNVASGNWTNECVQALAGRDVLILEDNDAAGREKAQMAAQLLHGVAKSVRVVRLPGLPNGGDVSDWLDVGHSSDQLIDVCFATPPWGSGAALPETTPQEPEKLRFVDIAIWATQQPPPREWAVPDRFPLRNVALLSGEGAVGKSILLTQLAAAVVLERDWLGTLPEPGPVLYLNAEDEEVEMHRRVAAVAAHYSVGLSDLKSDLHILALAGQDAVLGYPDRNGLIKPTPLFHKLTEAARDIRPKLIALDTSADVFGGNENDRAQVRQFIGLIRGMAIAANAAVIIAAHPSLTGINSGSGLSGNTAWHNSVRARAYMKSAKTEDGTEPDKALRLIEFMKSNYGPVAEAITVRWKDGVFIPEPRTGSLERLAVEAKADNIFLQLLQRFSCEGRSVGDKHGHSYAPALFSKEPEATAARLKKDTLAQAMRRLFASKKIHVEQYGRPSRPASKLTLGAPIEQPEMQQ
jgi:RecA-family ATPase